MEAHVTSQSQSFRLLEKMEQASIRHGQEIRADVPNVRVLALAGGEAGQVFFCNMGPIRVKETLHRGDDRALPTDVTVEGLQVSGSGTYDLLNVVVSSNGSVRLVVDDKTSVLPAASAVGARQAWAQV